jgi:predicted signal transduction protein with EAL and GGDEF domain
MSGTPGDGALWCGLTHVLRGALGAGVGDLTTPLGLDWCAPSRGVISGIAANPESRALIHTLVQPGKSLGLETVAEGIEETGQLDELQREACDSGQGYLFAVAR